MTRIDVKHGDPAGDELAGGEVTGGDVAAGAQEGPRGPALELQVKRLDPEVPFPSYAHEGDAGLDLAAAAEVTLEPGQRAAVPTGLALAIPPGWVGLVHPRSGLAHRHGVTVTNAPGTVDAGYRGEVQVLLINLGDAPVTLRRGDRIAQLLLQEVGRARVVEVAELDDTSRGDGGFGSTGIGEPVAPGARGLLPHG